MPLRVRRAEAATATTRPSKQARSDTSVVSTQQLLDGDGEDDVDDDNAVVVDWIKSVKQPDPHFITTATIPAKLKKELESMRSSIIDKNSEGCVHIKVCLAE